MSNIAGKAYAMNLITPVYTRRGYLVIFFIPGILCVLKSGSYFVDKTYGVFPVWAEYISLLFGSLFLLSGLAKWLKIGTSKGPDKVVHWLIGLLFFLAMALCCQNYFSSLLVGIFGISFLVLGARFYSNGVVWLNKLIFWLAGTNLFKAAAFSGLNTLSLIHYARWVILREGDFPRLSKDQPKETLKYGYMLFFSNFNGSWTQYVDSFSISIPSGLNLLWFNNVRWPNSVPETPFNKYVLSNQIWTDHYYNAYPKASSNDIKSAQKVKVSILDLCKDLNTISVEAFEKKYLDCLIARQSDISLMEETPVVSLATEAILKRARIDHSIA